MNVTPLGDLETLIKRFEKHLSTIRQYQAGLERETLRINPQGRLSLAAHPKSLGSALTHPKITVDFAESQLELVTPPFSNMTNLRDDLKDILAFTSQSIEHEYLWPLSMPPALHDDELFPADFGHSHSGMVKHVYRQGLVHRYGKKMQAICGIHFNFSLPKAFWNLTYSELKVPQKKFIFVSENYLGLMRNFLRHSWMLTYLFGASPTLDRSFLEQVPEGLKIFHNDTLYHPHATSLRMSNFGYVNPDRCQSPINYNSLTDYLAGLYQSVQTPSANYQKIGLKKDGHYLQLNTHVLQIENEHYSLIRPKQIIKPGERPFHALRQRGIEYVEVRGVDINPFYPTGITVQQMQFMRLFLMYCLFSENPPISKAEEWENDLNQNKVAMQGRQPHLKLLYQGKEVSMRAWADQVFMGLKAFAKMMGGRFPEYVAEEYKKFTQPELTPSAQILKAVLEEDGSHQAFGMRWAKQHTETLRDFHLSHQDRAHFQELSSESLLHQEQLEAQSTGTFDDYLAHFHDLKKKDWEVDF